jgi:hypothetical protein
VSTRGLAWSAQTVFRCQPTALATWESGGTNTNLQEEPARVPSGFARCRHTS